MRKVVRARVCWLTREEGGREEPPPPGTRHCPLIFLKEAPAGCRTWSADVLCGDLDADLCGLVELSLLVPQAPHQYLRPGNEFELYEGARLVARGRVL
jgi:hypothetical protein